MIEYQLEILGPDESGIMQWHRQPTTYPTASTAAMAAVAAGLPLDTASDSDTDDGAETWRIVPVHAQADNVRDLPRLTATADGDVVWCDGERVVRRDYLGDPCAAQAHDAQLYEPGTRLDVRG